MCRCTFMKDGRRCLLRQHTSEVRHCMVGPGGWIFDPPNPPEPTMEELKAEIKRLEEQVEYLNRKGRHYVGGWDRIDI